MIIRILSEGQYDVPDDEVAALNELDDVLEDAINRGDDDAFHATLGRLLDRVRSAGSEVALDALLPSTLLLPPADASLAEVRDLLNGDGLIPGRGVASGGADEEAGATRNAAQGSQSGPSLD
ncbi:MAG: PspA-associated protein PspAA [Nocardioidaceae bacterium]